MSCYYCPHYDDKCSESNPGDTVACQMDDPTQDHYGDTCMVDHYIRTGISLRNILSRLTKLNEIEVQCSEHDYVYAIF